MGLGRGVLCGLLPVASAGLPSRRVAPLDRRVAVVLCVCRAIGLWGKSKEWRWRLRFGRYTFIDYIRLIMYTSTKLQRVEGVFEDE